MPNRVQNAIKLLREAEQLTHVDLPADFLGLVDAATDNESTEAFQVALEAHKAKLRKEALAELEKFAIEFNVNGYDIVD